MTFKKIDEKTVCCMLSEEDLTDNDITVEDFLHNRDKVQDFLEEIIETAKEEVGFETSGHMLSIQIMGMQPDGVMITLSEDSKDLTKLMKAGALGMKDENNDLSELLQNAVDSSKVSKVRDLLQELEAVTKKMSQIKDEEADYEEAKDGLTMFLFSDMMQILNCVKHIPARVGVESSLYKNPDAQEYYLILTKKRISQERYRCVMSAAVEYGQWISSEEIHRAYIEEHFPCLIAGKAIQSLKKVCK